MTIKSPCSIKLLNIAWVGQGDFGDELMAFALRSFLLQKGFDAISYYQHGKFFEYRGRNDLKVFCLHKFNESGWRKALKNRFLLSKFNAIIVGGGSLLHSGGSIKWKWEVINKIKNRKDKFFAACVGVSLGPLKLSADEKIVAGFLDDIDMAVFRDSHSADWARRLSRNQKLLRSLDTSLILPEICPVEIASVREVKKEEDLVAVMFVKKTSKEDIFGRSKHLNKYLAIIDAILEKNKRIILFNLYIGDAYLDKELSELLKKKAKKPEWIQIHTFDGDIFRTLRELSRCGYVVSMRLHGIVSAYMFGIPFLSLAYDPKNQYFCDSVSYPKIMSFDFNSLEKVEPVLDSLSLLFENGARIFDGSMSVERATATVRDNLNSLAEAMNKKLL